MAYWLTYRKGSFEVKEKFPCQTTAHLRAAGLDDLAHWVEIVPDAEKHMHPRLAQAFEIFAGAVTA